MNTWRDKPRKKKEKKDLDCKKNNSSLKSIKLTSQIAENQYASWCRMVLLETFLHILFLACNRESSDLHLAHS